MLILKIFLVAIPLLLPAFDALSGLYSNAAGYNSVAYSSSNYGPPQHRIRLQCQVLAGQMRKSDKTLRRLYIDIL